MMNLADAAVTGGVTLATLGISWAIKALFNRDKDAAESFAKERETWRQDYDHAYSKIQKQCDDCEEQLAIAVEEISRRVDAFDGLIDDLEEQILPALMLPKSENVETARAVRAVMRTARARARGNTTP